MPIDKAEKTARRANVARMLYEMRQNAEGGTLSQGALAARLQKPQSYVSRVEACEYGIEVFEIEDWASECGYSFVWERMSGGEDIVALRRLNHEQERLVALLDALQGEDRAILLDVAAMLPALSHIDRQRLEHELSLWRAQYVEAAAGSVVSATRPADVRGETTERDREALEIMRRAENDPARRTKKDDG